MTDFSNRNANFLSVLKHQQWAITGIVNVELVYSSTLFSFSPAVPFFSGFPIFHLLLHFHLLIFILRWQSSTTPITEYSRVFDSKTLSNFTTNQKWQDISLAFCLSVAHAIINYRKNTATHWGAIISKLKKRTKLQHWYLNVIILLLLY